MSLPIRRIDEKLTLNSSQDRSAAILTAVYLFTGWLFLLLGLEISKLS